MPDVFQLHMDRSQKLASIVMERVRDSLCLILELFIQLPKSSAGLVESAVRHFIGRHCLHQEGACRPDHALRVQSSRQSRYTFRESPVMQLDHLYERPSFTYS